MYLIEDFDLIGFIALIYNIYYPVFIWDSSSHIIYANKTAYRHYGIKAEDFIRKSLEELTVN